MIRSQKWIAWLMVAGSLFCCLPSAFAQTTTVKTTDTPFRPEIRALGMGGAYVAAGRNGGAFLYNPALLTQTNTDIALPISFGVDQNTTNAFSYISDNSDLLETFDELTPEQEDQLFNDLTKFDGEKVRVRVSPMFNFATKNYGVAAYSVVRAGAGVDRGIFEPRVLAEGVADIVVAGGAARMVTPRLAVGGNVKIVNRRSTDFRVGVTQLGDTFDDVIDSLSNSKTGMGIDLGALYTVSQWTKVGFVIQDLYGKVGNSRFPVNVKVGIASTPVPQFTFAADLTDMLNQDGVSLFNRIFFGGEYRISLINARAGFYQGYPTMGAGVDLKVIKLDYAFYRREFTRRPGIEGRSQHEFQIKLGYGW